MRLIPLIMLVLSAGCEKAPPRVVPPPIKLAGEVTHMDHQHGDTLWTWGLDGSLHFTTVPEKFSMSISTDAGGKMVEVNKATYASFRVGDKVEYSYRKGWNGDRDVSVTKVMISEGR